MDYQEWLKTKKVSDPYTGLTKIPELNKMLFPFQHDVVSWALQLWSLPGDVVYSPFGGIASEGWESVKLGRKFVGTELKESYWKQACKNLKDAEKLATSGQLKFEE
jgi:DNA modification methylase